MIFRGEKVSKEEYEENPWLKILSEDKDAIVNPERVSSIDKKARNFVADYVGRTLDIAESHKELKGKEMYYVTTALKWCEVAKCGTKTRIASWKKKGYNLHVHNEASANIYRDFCKNKEKDADFEIIYALIYTHGLEGQYLRGEANLKENEKLCGLVKDGIIGKESLRRILLVLNEAVVRGVSEELWSRNKKKFAEITERIVSSDIDFKQDTLKRLKNLFPTAFGEVGKLTKEQKILFDEIFDKYSLWYPEACLDAFSSAEIEIVFRCIKRTAAGQNVRNISFYPFLVNIYYDYENHKKINIYKKRIIEFCFREISEGVYDPCLEKHVKMESRIENDTVFFNFIFTPVCEKLIDFCVEAERSGFMDYQKSITTVFDLFGFRRDVFDRLNNEDKYLSTMNSVDNSRKGELIEYAVGNIVVDVGSGGGVLLDKLEEKYGDKRIIGTDISENVIETLRNKKEKEGHKYDIIKHNFVEGTLENKADTIIFSSIMHEIYSYTEYEGERFNIKSVRASLKNAADSLNKGGRILIRDGVLTDSRKKYSVSFKTKDGVEFLKNYINDFRGLKNLKDESGNWLKNKVSLSKDNILNADVNFIREFLYTYTWGIESYPLEVNEQFGYLTLKEYCGLLKELGMKIIYAEEYLEPGYKTNLSKLVTLGEGLTFENMPSNLIIVAEK